MAVSSGSISASTASWWPGWSSAPAYRVHLPRPRRRPSRAPVRDVDCRRAQSIGRCTNVAGRSPVREGTCIAGLAEARDAVEFCGTRTDVVRRRGNCGLKGLLVTVSTKPDVDLTDGAFYAGDSRSVYKWMRDNEPVFRDRNGLAAAGADP